MRKNHRIEKILEENLTAIRNGRETIDSTLARYPAIAEELGPRLEAVLWLDNASDSCQPRPGFVTSSRRSLERQIAALPPVNAWQRLLRSYSPKRWIFNIASPILLIIILVLAINNLALTARLSIPGDPLYSTKLFIEDLQLVCTFNQKGKADLYIDFSRERTTEFIELVLEGDYAMLPSAADLIESELIATIHAVNNVPNSHSNLELPMVANLKDTLSNEVMLLQVLRETSPVTAHNGIDLAIQVAQSGVMALR
jgi:hypothetical protein